MATGRRKRWSKHLTEKSNALDLEKNFDTNKSIADLQQVTNVVNRLHLTKESKPTIVVAVPIRVGPSKSGATGAIRGVVCHG